MEVIKLTPNEMAGIRSVLANMSPEVDFEKKFKFAKIMKVCDDHIELMKSTITKPNSSEYEAALQTLYGEDMKGKVDEKLKKLDELQIKYKDVISEIENYNAEVSKAAKVKVDVNIDTISEKDLPSSISVQDIASLMSILKV